MVIKDSFCTTVLKEKTKIFANTTKTLTAPKYAKKKI